MQDDLNDDELEDLVDQIQVGDRTEGAQAIRKIMQRSADPDAIARGVRSTLARDRVRAEIQSGVREIERRNPDLAKDPLLADMGMTALRNQIAQDLRDIGASDEQLAPMMRNNQTMLAAHEELRIAGRGRPFSELVDAAAKDVKSRGVRLRTGSDRTPQAVIRERRQQELERRGIKDDYDYRPGRPQLSEADEARRAKVRQYINDARKARGQESYE